MYHFFISLILFIFVLWGRAYKKGAIRVYWLSTLIPIIAYSLVYGLREGWGVDFNHYKDIFIFARDTEWGLSTINSLIRFLGLNYSYAFIVYSSILSIGFFFIIKGYKNEAIYILPLLWVYSFGASALIRYWLAIGWLLISLHYLLRNKYIRFIIFYTISVSTHTSLIILLPLILFAKNNNWFTNRNILVCIYLAATIFLDKEMLGESVLMPFIELSSLYISNDRLEFYNENSEFWFSGDRILEVATNPLFETIHRIRNSITNLIILYLGFEIKDKYRNGVFFYNLMAVGFIFSNCTTGFELVNRYIAFLSLFSAFILGFIIDYQDKTRFIKNQLLYYSIIIFCYINLFYRPLLGSETMSYFTTWVWDK